MRALDPYLEGPLRAAYDTWQERALARFSPPLTFPEVRRGVQALSSLYVERRGEGNLAERALDGAAKRAAFACFYAPLHFLTLYHALRESELGRFARVVDLGCGTAAAGCAAALAIAARNEAAAPTLLGVDRSGFALGEARRTAADLGVRAAFRRGAIPDALPPLRDGDLAVLAWCANELGEATRAALLAQLLELAARGVGVVVAEPLATGVAPWWRSWVAAFADLGGHAREARVRLALPAFVARLDRAAGLDHGELGARVLCVVPSLRSPQSGQSGGEGEHASPRSRGARTRGRGGRRRQAAELGPESTGRSASRS